MKKGLVKSSTHSLAQATPIIPPQFALIIQLLNIYRPAPYVFIVALILAYLTLFRQSNLVSGISGPGPLTLLHGDVVVKYNVLYTCHSQIF